MILMLMVKYSIEKKKEVLGLAHTLKTKMFIEKVITNIRMKMEIFSISIMNMIRVETIRKLLVI